jgi:hypothetical protein
VNVLLIRGSRDIFSRAVVVCYPEDASAHVQTLIDMARKLKALQEPVLFFDISRRPSADAELISTEMGAIYRPLPIADLAQQRARHEKIEHDADLRLRELCPGGSARHQPR